MVKPSKLNLKICYSPESVSQQVVDAHRHIGKAEEQTDVIDAVSVNAGNGSYQEIKGKERGSLRKEKGDNSNYGVYLVDQLAHKGELGVGGVKLYVSHILASLYRKLFYSVGEYQLVCKLNNQYPGQSY